jgi:class 3 adenylate cyclase
VGRGQRGLGRREGAALLAGVGIHTGDALKDADHFFGTTVHFAARVASQAVGGEVLVSNTVHDLVHGVATGFEFLDGRDVELKGIAGRHRLWAIR